MSGCDSLASHQAALARHQEALARHQKALARCRRCAGMQGRPVLGNPVASGIVLVGQAPGSKELLLRRPFAWTAGKTMFRWFESIGLAEEALRTRLYMAAVCRCFPGKNPAGGDRVPSPREIANCAPWLEAELRLLRPALVIPVGRLAIGRFMAVDRLDAVIGKCYCLPLQGVDTDLIPLPHPSGASTWHRAEPGKILLERALGLIRAHPAWQALAAPAATARSAAARPLRNHLAPGVARATPAKQPAQGRQRDGARKRE
ncbi:MAG: uracil-DNA glycosylase family protein [Burkholderiales bacterium]